MFVSTSAACGSDSAGSGGSKNSAADTSGVAVGKVSANNATDVELEAAFEAAGIPNAGQWAHEVDEYRPYPADDTGLAKLRRELSKYNPASGVVDQIVALLELP